jgi:hypothetical protein
VFWWSRGSPPTPAVRRCGAGEVVEQQLPLLGCVRADDVGDVPARRADDLFETRQRVRDGFDDHSAPVDGVGGAADVAGAFEPVNQPCCRAGGETRAGGQFAGGHGAFEVEQAEGVPLGRVEARGFRGISFRFAPETRPLAQR